MGEALGEAPRNIDVEVDADEVRRTLATGDLDAIEELFDALWYWLPSLFSGEVLAAVDGVDPATFADRPRLLNLVMLAHHRQQYAGVDDIELTKILSVYRDHGRRYADRLADFMRPSELQTAGTIAVFAARSNGAYRRAEQLGTWVDHRLQMLEESPALPWSSDHVRAKPGWLTTQRGVTATLTGNLDQAVRLYTRAVAEAGPPPGAHFAGTHAAANLALITAFRGQFDLARQWIEQASHSGPLPHWVEHLTTVGAKVARALIATEECQPELARASLEAAGPATQRVELWPFVAYAWANYHATFGTPHRGLVDLDAARLAHGVVSGTEHGFAGEALLRAEAMLLLSAGHAVRVFNLAKAYPTRYPLRYVARAQLLIGRPEFALRTAARALRRDRMLNPLNDVIDLHMTMAIAFLRTGDRERAAKSFADAVNLRSTDAHLKPFLAATRSETAALAELAGIRDPLADLPERAHQSNQVPDEAVLLTPREAAVLEALDDGLTATVVARRFGVSVHTVRSQIASAYRKLGVNSREAALARAHLLGVLAPSKTRERGQQS